MQKLEVSIHHGLVQRPLHFITANKYFRFLLYFVSLKYEMNGSASFWHVGNQMSYDTVMFRMIRTKFCEIKTCVIL